MAAFLETVFKDKMQFKKLDSFGKYLDGTAVDENGCLIDSTRVFAKSGVSVDDWKLAYSYVNLGNQGSNDAMHQTIPPSALVKNAIKNETCNMSIDVQRIFALLYLNQY